MSAPRALPAVKTQSWWNRLWRPFWVLPLVICSLAFALGVVLPVLDATVGEHLPFVFQGGSDGARSLLGTIASAMISVTGLVFSITMVVLQLASSQFTPRVLGNFLSSRVTQATLGVFTASFVYALTVQRVVRGGEDVFVPQLSVTVAFVLVVASVGMFMAFINHITTSIQVSQIISRVGDETIRIVRDYFPEPGPPDRPAGASGAGASSAATTSRGPGVPVTSGPRHGHVAQIDYGALGACADELDATVEVTVPVGSFVTEEQVVAVVRDIGDCPDEARESIARAITLEADRAPHQDPAFGIRRLVDIADRALSPGINDPTTATQVVDELHRILRVLVQRETPQAAVETDGGGRIVHRPQTVPELLSLAVEELLHYGEGSVQIPTRLRDMLTDLHEQALPPYRSLIRRWLDAILDRVPRESRP